MGQFGQTNDLQEAIDQASKNDKAKESSSEKDGNVDQIQAQFGVPPMPEPFPAPETSAPFSDILPPADGQAASNNANTPTSAPIDIVNPVQPSAPEAPKTPENNTAPSAEQILSESLSSNGVSNDSAENTEAPVEPTSGEAGDNSANMVPEGSSDMNQVRENILRELLPLMDEVEGTPGQKFDIYKDAIDSLNDKNLVGDALKYASQIADKKEKANALMSLMQEVKK